MFLRIILVIATVALGSCAQSPAKDTSKSPPTTNKKQVVTDDPMYANSSHDTPILFNDTSQIPRWILDTLSSFPEIKGLDAVLKKSSRHDKDVLFLGELKKDSSGTAYYVIQAGEDNDVAFVTHFWFNVYPDNKKILLFDIVDDTLIGLDTWRKREKEAAHL